jgi:hypothetical protein
MAVIKLRTAIVIVLTILAAAVFSLILLPRWQSRTKAGANFPKQTGGDQSLSVDPKPLPAESRGPGGTSVDKLDADKEAMWSPQGQPAAPRKSGQLPPVNFEAERVARGPAPDTPRSEFGKRPEPAENRGEAAGDGERPLNLRNLKEVSIESQPMESRRPNSEGLTEKTPNAVKYEQLKKLLGRMHDPLKGMDGDLGRNNNAQRSRILTKEALEKLAEKYNSDDGTEERFEIVDKGKEPEREIPLRFEPDNERERARPRERQPTFGMNKGPPNPKGGRWENTPDTNINRNNNNMMADRLPKSDNGANARAAMGINPDHQKVPTIATTPVLTTTTVPSTTTPPATTLPPTPNPAKDLPSMKRGSVVIRPERLPPPAIGSDIYYSLLTAPLYHNLRFSLQYLTWLQTVDPKQVSRN